MLSDDVTRKVRALLDRANHPGTPQAEAALAMAYRLMAKYDVDERLSCATILGFREVEPGEFRGHVESDPISTC